MKPGKRNLKLICCIFLAVTFLTATACHKPDNSVHTTQTEAAYGTLIPNFPVSISRAMSYAPTYEDLKKTEGACDYTMKESDTCYYIWQESGYHKIAITQQGRLQYYFYTQQLPTYDFFTNLPLETLDDVKKVDPYTKIYEIDNGAFSDHLLADGSFLHIVYALQGESLIVNEMTLSQSGFSGFDKLVNALQEK